MAERARLAAVERARVLEDLLAADASTKDELAALQVKITAQQKAVSDALEKAKREEGALAQLHTSRDVLAKNRQDVSTVSAELRSLYEKCAPSWHFWCHLSIVCACCLTALHVQLIRHLLRYFIASFIHRIMPCVH